MVSFSDGVMLSARFALVFLFLSPLFLERLEMFSHIYSES